MADRPRTDPIEELARKLADMERRLQDFSSAPLRIPEVAADPDASYLGNIWTYSDGKLNIRLKDGTLKQYTPVAPAPPPGAPAPPTPQPITRQAVWSATWGQAYRASGGPTGANNSMLYQGSSGDSYNGRQRSLIGFDYASIQSALAGSSVTAVDFWIDLRHTYWNGGGTFCLGSHNNASKPGVWGGTTGRDFISNISVPNSGGRWYSVSTEFGSSLRDGSAKGITLQAPNNDRTYYGYASGGPGTSSDRMPVIRVTYVK